MGKISFLITVLLGQLLAFKAFGGDVLSRCKQFQPNDKQVYSGDFRWGFSLDELLSKASEIYNSGKRLKDRAYFDGAKKQFVMPINYFGKAVPAALHPRFLQSVKKHIEIAFKNNYADALIFPDMGHSHFFIPKDVYAELNKIDYVNNRHVFYEELFKSPEVKTLYHTAEQMVLREGERSKGKLVDNDYTRWRYYTRNVVGKNDGSDDVKPVFAQNENYNTLHELPGYEYFGAGFNLSASKEGCFEVTIGENQTIFFDLSMEDLNPSTTYAPELNL
ncbi:MAG: hypothetical protein IPM57_07910 [Oligoflexia bacterium]|nr:hypothetical protein [Oligoflexia bacterium]